VRKLPPCRWRFENLAPLAKAGAPILHDCGSLDPWLKNQILVAEKRYKQLGGKITVLVTEGAGHFPLQPKDPKRIQYERDPKRVAWADSNSFPATCPATPPPVQNSAQSNPTNQNYD
jgi:hypothetical protein